MAENNKLSSSIIILDDDELIRMIARKMLTSSGYTNVTITDQPRTALQRIDGGSVDLIICDWHMPKVTGLEVYKSIQNIHPSLPYIMLTAERKKERVVEALDAGVKSYIVKPFSKEELLNKVEEQLTKATK